MEESMKYKVGDIVYGESRYNGLCKYTVVRTTNTLAVLSNEAKLPIDRIGWCSAKGSLGYDRTLYHIETEDLKKKYEKQMKIKFVKQLLSSILDKLTDDEIESL